MKLDNWKCDECGKVFHKDKLDEGGQMGITYTNCPYCKSCVHTMTRYLDYDTNLIICCACGVDFEENNGRGRMKEGVYIDPTIQ